MYCAVLALLDSLLNASLDLGLGKPILWREIIGNLVGLVSMLLGAQRRTAAWTIGILGNVLLFTVFLGGVFSTPQELDLWGQAGRQVLFAVVSCYGWWRWRRGDASGGDEGPVAPRWARPRERLTLLAVIAVLLLVTWMVLRALNSWNALADAWILTGSLIATFGMARGWIDFWLVWIAVDAVGVPLLLTASYYPSALMYLVYAGMCLYGMRTWIALDRRRRKREQVPIQGLGTESA